MGIHDAQVERSIDKAALLELVEAMPVLLRVLLNVFE
jgi:hypothetical protein